MSLLRPRHNITDVAAALWSSHFWHLFDYIQLLPKSSSFISQKDKLMLTPNNNWPLSHVLISERKVTHGHHVLLSQTHTYVGKLFFCIFIHNWLFNHKYWHIILKLELEVPILCLHILFHVLHIWEIAHLYLTKHKHVTQGYIW